MEENKSKGIFLGVVGVATLIVAIIGATFAYFVASTGGNTVYNLCSIYQFTVSNTASIAQTIYASLTANTNTFTNLKYCIFEGEAGTSDTEKVACRNMPAKGTTDSNVFSELIPATTGTHTYTLVMYINETEGDQTAADSGKAFTGTISITSADGSNYMTGALSAKA